MEVIAELSNRAVHEYEGLREDCERYKMECRRIEEERDEAMRRLKEFQRVSHMVIEEVGAMQENLEVEKSCRQSAEALASKLNRQNRSLKRKSLQLLSHLGPEVITEISLEEDEDEDPEDKHDNVPCSSSHCLKVITELQGKLVSTLEAKAQLAIELEVMTNTLREVREELLKEKHDNTVLITKTVEQKALLGKYTRVSQLAVEEHEALHDRLQLEKDLRTEAEKFAREMVVEQKKLKRQSQVLLKNSLPSEALQEALAEVSRLTQLLEEERMDHQKQLDAIQVSTGRCEEKEVSSLRRQIQLLEEEKREWQDRTRKAEEQSKDLRFTVEELQKKLQAVVNPVPVPAPPPPPPPPPLPPPPPPASSNPLSSLLSMMRKRKQTSDDIALIVQDSSGMEPEKKTLDIRQQAVEEMMQRIKKGVNLRPVRQTTRQPEREEIMPDSAVQELKEILDTFKRASPVACRAGVRVGTTQTELERALQRRRCAVESGPQTSQQPPPTPPLLAEMGVSVSTEPTTS